MKLQKASEIQYLEPVVVKIVLVIVIVKIVLAFMWWVLALGM